MLINLHQNFGEENMPLAESFQTLRHAADSLLSSVIKVQVLVGPDASSHHQGW